MNCVIYAQLGMRVDELFARHLVLTHGVHTLEHTREAARLHAGTVRLHCTRRQELVEQAVLAAAHLSQRFSIFFAVVFLEESTKDFRPLAGHSVEDEERGLGLGVDLLHASFVNRQNRDDPVLLFLGQDTGNGSCESFIEYVSNAYLMSG